MAKEHYLPSTDAEKVTWLQNFAGKLSGYSVTFGLTTADTTSVNNDWAMVNYMWGLLTGSRTRMQEITAYKQAVFNGGAEPALGAVPTGYTGSNSPPSVVLPDVFGRIAALVARLKTHSGFTTAIGEDLGIIGPEATVDANALKPSLDVVPVAGGLCEVRWKKGKASAIEIEVDRGTGAGFVFLAIDSIPHYTDTHTLPPGTAAVWKYRAIYRIGDERVGQWSDLFTCAVRG